MNYLKTRGSATRTGLRRHRKIGIITATMLVLCVILQAFFSFANMNEEAEIGPDSAPKPAAEQPAVTSDPALGAADDSAEKTAENDSNGADPPIGVYDPKGVSDENIAKPAGIMPMPAAAPKGLKFLALNATQSSFVYREKDGAAIDRNTRWLKTNYSDAAVSGYRQFTIDRSLLKDDVAYDFVLTYMTNDLTNLPTHIYKNPGVFTRKSDGTWDVSMAESDVADVNLLPSDNDFGCEIKQKAHPKHLYYSGEIVTNIAAEPKNAHLRFELYDALDGTPSLSNPYTNHTQVFTYSSLAKNANPARIPGYKQYKAIGDGADSEDNMNKKSVMFPYSLAYSGFLKATGVYEPWGNDTSSPKTGNRMTPDSDNHTVTATGAGTFFQRFTFKLKSEEIIFSIPVMATGRGRTGLLAESKVEPEAASAAQCEVIDSPDGLYKVIRFSGVTGKETVRLRITAEGIADIPLEFEADKADSSVKLLNLNEIESLTNDVAYNAAANQFDRILQKPRLDITETDEGWVASSKGLTKFLEQTSTYYPGTITPLKFMIANGDANRTFILKDYSVGDETMAAEGLLRTAGKNRSGKQSAIEKFFDIYANDYPGVRARPLVEYIYNFEGITGMNIYDALLKMYRENGYSGINSLSELPGDIIANEIFGGLSYKFAKNQVDPAGEHPSVDLGDHGGGYQFFEKNEKMIALANSHLYENALAMTFDSKSNPLPALENPKPESEHLMYRSYVNRTPKNVAMMKKILSGISAMSPGGSANFDDFQYAIYGGYIHDAYRPTDYGISFNLKFKLAVVGIEGIAFEDVNENGNFDSAEKTFGGVPVELWQDGGTAPIAVTTTNDAGRYEFPNVNPGSGYYIKIKTPDKYEVTPIVGTEDSDNKFDADGTTKRFAVELGRAYQFNAGFVAEKIKPDPEDPAGPVEPTDPSDPTVDPDAPESSDLEDMMDGKPDTGDDTDPLIDAILCAGALILMFALFAVRRSIRE
ncbi:MAG: hypothetical protein LBQ21_00300 [Clostridiales Family XIII bacterium]|jgi:hypothetical protein|nr:hypothetical protein [Clostridiales Family XIII bacterium]